MQRKESKSKSVWSSLSLLLYLAVDIYFQIKKKQKFTEQKMQKYSSISSQNFIPTHNILETFKYTPLDEFISSAAKRPASWGSSSKYAKYSMF